MVREEGGVNKAEWAVRGQGAPCKWWWLSLSSLAFTEVLQEWCPLNSPNNKTFPPVHLHYMRNEEDRGKVKSGEKIKW